MTKSLPEEKEMAAEDFPSKQTRNEGSKMCRTSLGSLSEIIDGFSYDAKNASDVCLFVS